MHLQSDVVSSVFNSHRTPCKSCRDFQAANEYVKLLFKSLMTAVAMDVSAFTRVFTDRQTDDFAIAIDENA